MPLSGGRLIAICAWFPGVADSRSLLALFRAPWDEVLEFGIHHTSRTPWGAGKCREGPSKKHERLEMARQPNGMWSERRSTAAAGYPILLSYHPACGWLGYATSSSMLERRVCCIVVFSISASR